ncbi:hypothetical protein KPH14_010550 [Odynerus spinipes]|uniref:Receptor expression-enhancing protein n=1 Tax=Odynerus spinipes TaxID=1348599 RepID=A0AAD9RUC2_9HYME|nr:hypothetical protein KPH14_010550 [Odynerus spinipes]
MISSIVSRLVILVFGTLYPAYASYKAVRTQNVKEYVKWMMYWIVFALFTCAETFTDVFFSFWFPFYYEIKIILVLWLLSPATKGSSILYRRFVHPALTRREAEIDEALARATEQGYKAVLHLGTRGVNYATTVLMQTAIKNLPGIIPSTSNEILASQSDPAIFSSASHKAPPQSTRRSRSRKDSVDGGSAKEEEKSKVLRRATKQVDRNAARILDNGDYQDTTSSNSSSNSSEEELEAEQIAGKREETYEDVQETMIIEKKTSVFKEPKKRETSMKRSGKEHVEVTRRQRSRSCKNTVKPIYEPEFSDNSDYW